MRYKLEEIANIYDSLHQTPTYIENGIPMVRVTDLDDGYLKLNKTLKVSKEVYNEFTKKYIPRKNDIIMSRVGTYGICTLVNTEEKFCLGQNTVIISPKEDKKFLYYYLKSDNVRKQIESFVTGSTQKTISLKSIKNIIVDLPNVEQQKRVSNILDTIDRKIELNNKINDNLLEFVGNIYDEKIIKNDNATLMKMNELVEKTIGGDWGKEELTGNYNSEVLCIRGADIPELDNGNKGKAPTRFILEKNLNNKQLHGEEIIIEISGGSSTQSTGRCTYITEELEKAFDKSLICTNFCRAIKLKENKYLPIFYMNLKHLYKKNIMFLYENGTTGIKNLDLISLLKNEEIKIVDDEILNEFNELYYITNKKIIQNASENIVLEELRDRLIPKLMNGEINLDKLEI